MAEEIDNYELVSVYHLNEDDAEALLLAQKECTFNWCTRDNWPMGVIMSYIWRDGRMWLTAGRHLRESFGCERLLVCLYRL